MLQARTRQRPRYGPSQLTSRIQAQAGRTVWEHIISGAATASPSLLNRFLLITFADLKRFAFYYWFAFPALVPPQPLRALAPPQRLPDAVGSVEAAEWVNASVRWRAGSGKTYPRRRNSPSCMCAWPSLALLQLRVTLSPLWYDQLTEPQGRGHLSYDFVGERNTRLVRASAPGLVSERRPWLTGGPDDVPDAGQHAPSTPPPPPPPPCAWLLHRGGAADGGTVVRAYPLSAHDTLGGFAEGATVLAFADPCALAAHPGWPLRNLLVWAAVTLRCDTLQVRATRPRSLTLAALSRVRAVSIHLSPVSSYSNY